MIIAQLKDLPLQIKFPSVVKLIALKDLCWIVSFGQHPRHIEKEHASREKKLSMVIFLIFRSGLRFSFRALEVPESRVRERSF